MRRTATLMAALAVAFAATAATVRTATENFVTNKIAEAVAAIPSPDYSTNNTELVETIEAKAPTPDLSPFLRSDKSDNEVQIFGGLLSVKIHPPYCTETKNMLSCLHQPARLGLSGA